MVDAAKPRRWVLALALLIVGGAPTLASAQSPMIGGYSALGTILQALPLVAGGLALVAWGLGRLARFVPRKPIIVFGWIFFSLGLTLLLLCTVILIDAGVQGALIAGGTIIIAVLAARELGRASLARRIAARPPVDTPDAPST